MAPATTGWQGANDGPEVPVRYDANLSMLFTELPFLQRPEAAAAAGFDAVEFWWPFDRPVPSDRDVEALVETVRRAGVEVVSLNLFPGDMATGDRGLLSWPGREAEFRDALDAAVGVGAQLGCRAYNVLYGNRLPGVRPELQDEIALQNLRVAAEAARVAGAVVLLEPLSAVPAYPLRTAADAAAVIAAVEYGSGPTSVEILFDLYHLTANGDDIPAAIDRYGARVGHVQIADYPGRHEPGTGRVDLQRLLVALFAAGYTGFVGAEYLPATTTLAGLDWVPRERRSGRFTPDLRR